MGCPGAGTGCKPCRRTWPHPRRKARSLPRSRRTDPSAAPHSLPAQGTTAGGTDSAHRTSLPSLRKIGCSGEQNASYQHHSEAPCIRSVVVYVADYCHNCSLFVVDLWGSSKTGVGRDLDHIGCWFLVRSGSVVSVRSRNYSQITPCKSSVGWLVAVGCMLSRRAGTD